MTVQIQRPQQQQQQQRLYAAQEPEWQRFQTASLAPSFCGATSGHFTSVSGGTGSTAQQHGYQRQYAHVYHQRLSVLGQALLVGPPLDITNSNDQNDAIMDDLESNESSAARAVARILELPEDVLVTCVGTLVREGSAQLADGAGYFLEDESGRVALFLDATTTVNGRSSRTHTTGTKHQSHALCTGLVIRVTGVVGIDGVLRVRDVATVAIVNEVQPHPPTNALSSPSPLASCGQPSDTPPLPLSQSTTAPHLLLLSGLECGSAMASSLPRDMLLSYIQGLFGHKASTVAHIVLAGGLIGTTTTTTQQQQPSLADGCRDLDGFVRQLTKACGVPVTVLPGKDDPTTAQWPQRPLHSSLLPHSTATGLLSRSPNPYAATFVVPSPVVDPTEDQRHRRLVIGTDGANVADFMKQTGLDSELEALRHTLAHQHICPTGPDTLPTAPHAETDPMVLKSFDQAPSVYFSGNATHFATQLVTVQTRNANDTISPEAATGLDAPTLCRLVCIPKFIESGTAVLVNLDSLAVELLKFDASDLE
jgi:DNA polymerase delta subunit 2